MELAEYKAAVRRRLYLIYALNVADWVCTVVLLGSGDFIEANPLMRLIIHNIPMGFVIKCVLPAAIITLILRMLAGLAYAEVRTVDRFVGFAVGFYTLLCADHILNFVILFFAQRA